MNIQDLYEALIGPEQYNPLTGDNNAGSVAQKLGISVQEAHNRINAFRDYIGKKQRLDAILKGSGYTQEDLGRQNIKEHGKSGFEQDDWAVQNGFRPNGYEYDWASGKKHYVISSDPDAINRWEDITPEEKQAHDQAGQLRAKGFNDWTSMVQAQNALKNGADINRLDPRKFQGHRSVDVDYLAKTFGVDPSTVQQYQSLLGSTRGQGNDSSFNNSSNPGDYRGDSRNYDAPINYNAYGYQKGHYGDNKFSNADKIKKKDLAKAGFTPGKVPTRGHSAHIDPVSGFIEPDPAPNPGTHNPIDPVPPQPAPQNWSDVTNGTQQKLGGGSLPTPLHGLLGIGKEPIKKGAYDPPPPRKTPLPPPDFKEPAQNFQSPVPGMNRTKPNFSNKPYNYGA